MKRIMFTLAALVAVATTHAAYVDWQYSVSEPKTGGEDWTSGYTAYLVESSEWDKIKDNVTAAGLSGAAMDSSSFFLESTTKKNNNYATGASGSAGIRQVTADSGNYYVILATADGYNVAINNVAVTAYTDASGAGTGLTPSITSTTPVEGSGVSFTAFGGGGGGGGAPEPTSGLLMLVGGAMLALRRKQK